MPLGYTGLIILVLPLGAWQTATERNELRVELEAEQAFDPAMNGHAAHVAAGLSTLVVTGYFPGANSCYELEAEAEVRGSLLKLGVTAGARVEDFNGDCVTFVGAFR